MFHFGSESQKNRAELHPLLERIVDEAIKTVDFMILDGSRTKAEQEKFFAKGTSKVHFGQSAHNWSPAIAMDLFPAPYDWNNKQSFIDLSKVILAIPKKLGLISPIDGKIVVLRWGGDFNMDGSKTTTDAWDAGHYELHHWRDYAKLSKPYTK